MPDSENKAYESLIRQVKEIFLLRSCGEVLGWDERTYLPKAGVGHRAEQLALLASMVHARVTSPEIGELLSQVEESDLVADFQSVQAVNVREIRHIYDQQVKVPLDLVVALARVTTLSQQAWGEARAASDFKMFRPHLEEVLNLKRQVAAALDSEGTAYDALMDEYEPGETTANLTQIFADLREDLVALVEEIVGSVRKPDLSILTRTYPVSKQAAFGKAAAEHIGFNFEAGRIDETTHPFCIGLGPGDTRITTRYDQNHFSEAFFGILHETGHGLYEQGLPTDHYGTPMGRAVSLGIHESQSRMWENMVGRSLAFWHHFFPKVQAAFPNALGDVGLDDFHFAINHVSPSFIRVDADEATYNLHILIRYDLEQALIDDDLQAADVPDAWNESFKRYMGITPSNDAEGCLQDIHWSGGGIGYFPTYTLGNLYAAQFFDQARTDIGDLDAQFEAGNFTPLKDWLTDKIYRHGQRYRAGELVEEITGQPLSHRPLIEQLKAKYKPLYGN